MPDTLTDTVTITRAEYDRLLEAAEDLADIAAYDAAMADPGEGMPGSILMRIIAGENPVRVIREWRGLTAAETARKAGIHRVQLHDIETGKRQGSIATVKAIAEALNVPVDDLI